MKDHWQRIWFYLLTSGFIAYWLILIVIVLPGNTTGKLLERALPRFKTTFGINWQLFSPPPDYETRLYYVLRDTSVKGGTDTVEVLHAIALDKQRNAPFNQRENVIDHLVNNSVNRLLRTVYQYTPMPSVALPETLQPGYIAGAIARANKNAYQLYLSSIKNYCAYTIQQKEGNSNGKEIRLIIKRQQIKPFGQRNELNYTSPELLLFESPYHHLQ